MTRITQLVLEQDFQKAEELNQENSALHRAFVIWKPEMAAWKGVPWGQTRADLVGDFVRAAISDIKLMYGRSATGKSVNMACLTLTESQLSSVKLHHALPNGHTFEWSITRRPESQEQDLSNKVSTTPESVEPIPLEERWVHAETITDEAALAIIAQVEAQLKEPLEARKGPGIDIDLLNWAASFWLAFEEASLYNAKHATYTQKGLTCGGELVCPGEEFVAEGVRVFEPKPALVKKIRR